MYAIERKADNNFYYIGTNNNSKIIAFDSKALYFIVEDILNEYDNQVIDGYYSSMENIVTTSNSLNYTFYLQGLDY